MKRHNLQWAVEQPAQPRVRLARNKGRLRAAFLATLVAVCLQAGLLVALAAQDVFAAAPGAQAVHAAPLQVDDGFDVANNDGDSDDDPQDMVRYGILSSRPANKVGTWVIGGIAYTVETTTLLDGFFVAGDCVELLVAEQAPTVALKIVEKEPSQCGGLDDGDDGDNGENDGDEENRELEGILVSVPPLLLGQWELTIRGNKTVTFATSLLTSFDPVSAEAFAVGKWVEVKLQRQLDGSWLAERVRVDDYETGEIVVRLQSSVMTNAIAAKYGLVLTSTLLSDANIYLFTTGGDEQEVAEKVAQDEGVIWAEVNYVNSVPEDDGYKTWGWGGPSEPDAYASQSAYQQIRMGLASRQYQGEGIVVAVLDTGVYPQHEQFAGRLQLPSLDVMDDDNDPVEVGPGMAWGHGTHIAGVIAAMAPKATILPVRVLDENGRGNTFLLAYAIEWVAQQPGVKVINLSLGTQFDSKILRDVIADVTAAGIVVVAAAGNNNSSQIQYPAGYADVVSVTAVDDSSIKASFANYGSEWVDIAAPGVNIMSTMINEDGPGYATWSGTSMATAFVSGAAVLVAEKRGAQSALFGEMLAQIVDTGLSLDALNPGFSGQIGRQLDVSAALDVDAALLYLPQSGR